MKTIQLYQRKRSQAMNSDAYETPNELLQKLCNRYKIHPKLDVCATKLNRKCKRYFNKKMNGLKKKWNTDVWCNPPHNMTKYNGKWISQVELFVRKAYSEWRRTRCGINILMIIPTNTMSSDYWHECIEKGGVFYHPIHHRIKFKNKHAIHSARNAYICVIWRKY